MNMALSPGLQAFLISTRAVEVPRDEPSFVTFLTGVLGAVAERKGDSITFRTEASVTDEEATHDPY